MSCGVRSANSSVIYGTPQGELIEAPADYRAVTAQNGKGLVLLPEEQTLDNNSNIIRYVSQTLRIQSKSRRS